MGTERPPRPQLSCVQCTATSAKVVWTVDARKLYSKDRALVSPSFALPMGCPVPLRLVVQAKTKSQQTGGEQFGKAKGVGSVLLKCEAVAEDVLGDACLDFSICVGDQAWRGPVLADLACDGVFGLPPRRQNWNFRSAVDAASNTFAVSLYAEWKEPKPEPCA